MKKKKQLAIEDGDSNPLKRLIAYDREPFVQTIDYWRFVKKDTPPLPQHTTELIEHPDYITPHSNSSTPRIYSILDPHLTHAERKAIGPGYFSPSFMPSLARLSHIKSNFNKSLYFLLFQMIMIFVVIMATHELVFLFLISDRTSMFGIPFYRLFFVPSMIFSLNYGRRLFRLLKANKKTPEEAQKFYNYLSLASRGISDAAIVSSEKPSHSSLLKLMVAQCYLYQLANDSLGVFGDSRTAHSNKPHGVDQTIFIRDTIIGMTLTAIPLVKSREWFNRSQLFLQSAKLETKSPITVAISYLKKTEPSIEKAEKKRDVRPDTHLQWIVDGVIKFYLFFLLPIQIVAEAGWWAIVLGPAVLAVAHAAFVVAQYLGKPFNLHQNHGNYLQDLMAWITTTRSEVAYWSKRLLETYSEEFETIFADLNVIDPLLFAKPLEIEVPSEKPKNE